MNEPTDDLFQRLSAADPIDHHDLPTAEDGSAQRLLENAMSDQSPAHQTSISPIAAATDENPYAWPTGDDATGAAVVELDKGRRRRNPLLLLSAAAAVLLLVGGVLVFAPDNTPSAVATVHNAAAATADVDSARITINVEIDGTDGVEEGQLSGQLDAAYTGSDIAFSLQIEDQGDDFFGEEVPFNEARLVDDVAYIDADGEWFAVDTDGLLGDMVSDFLDPRAALAKVQELTETTEVGSATVDGVATTHYQSVVDLGDEESLVSSGWLPLEAMDVDTDGELTIDLFVDGDGVLRQLDLSGDVQDTSGSGESGTFDIATRFYDFGADIQVEAPADVEVIDPLQGLLGDN